MFSQMNNFQQRLVMSSVCTAFMLAAIYLSHSSPFNWIFVLLMAGIIGLALWEYYHIAHAKEFYPLKKIGLIGTVAYTFAIFLSSMDYPQAYQLPYVIIGLTLAAGFLYFFVKGLDPFVNLAVTFFGILYLTIPLNFIVSINYFSSKNASLDGRWCLLYLLTVTKMTDTGAFFIGKIFGRTQLCPLISPKKTWEGAIGGLLTAVAISLVFYGIMESFQTPPLSISLGESLLLGCLISITAQFGDLSESLLKRNMGVKDSSHLPGLGGVLDIVDSVVFTAPLMYLFLILKENNL